MFFLIITTVMILSFLVFTFVKAILSKFNNYLFTLIIEVIGAFIDFVFIIANQEPSVPVYLIIYLLLQFHTFLRVQTMLNLSQSVHDNQSGVH